MKNQKEHYNILCKISDELENDLTSLREYLHKNPELGRVEYKTSQLLQEKLNNIGDYKITPVGETGFCADLVTATEKPWIALRADMDALPIQDQKNVPYRSSVDGVCHACGHDFHSTVVFGVAAVLKNFTNILPCNIRFIFQHAEEPTPGGAIDFVKAGMLDDISAIIGLHADPVLPVSKLGIIRGWISAQSIHLKFNIRGEGGHSAKPNETSDPIHTGVLILNELYSSLYRKYNIDSPFVFTIGMLKAGDSYNSISPDFSAEGTLRVTDPRQGDNLLCFIEKSFNEMISRYGLNGNLEWIKGAPPVLNDAKLTNRAISIISEIINKDQLCEHPRSMGGEDFSQFLAKASGVFIRIGVGKGEKIHTGLFDINKKSIIFGVKVFSWLLLNLAKGDTN